MADGSIRIETKLDVAALKRQKKELEKELDNIRKEQAKVDAQADAAHQKHEAEKEMDAQFPEEMSHREEIDEKAAKELDPIIEKQEELNQKEQEQAQLLDEVNAKLVEQEAILDAAKQVDAAVKTDAAAAKIDTEAKYHSMLDTTAAKMHAIEDAAEGVAQQTGVSKQAILDANPAYQKLVDTMSVLDAKADEFGDEAQEAGNKAKKAMDKAEKSTKKVGDATSKGIANLGKMQLVMSAIRLATRAISAATQEYMAVNTELAAQISTLKTLWGQVLGPAIEWVVNLLLQAVTAVNSFVYALSGINFVARANEAALKKQGKAASAANKAQQAGFDEQTKLSDASGGGDNAAGQLNEAIISLPEKLMEMLDSGNWYGVGKFVGEELMNAIDGLPWHDIGSTIGEVVGGAAAAALGLVLSIDPMTILTSAMELASGLLDSISEVIQDLDWNEIGRDIVDLLLFSLAVLNPTSLILPLLLTPEGEDLVSSASEFVGTVLGALLSAIIGAGQKIGEMALEIWNTLKTYFEENVDWEGTPEEIIQGLWAGIVEALKDAGQWIYDNIWVPFRDGFKEAFDIHSPSGRMKEFGVNLMDGLKNGITGAISKVTNACREIWTAIKGVFSTVGTWFKETFSQAWQKVKEVFSKGGKIFDGIKEGISSTFKTIVNGLIDGINRIIKVPFNAINGMLNTIRGIEVLGVTPFKGLWSYNPLSIPQIPKLAMGGIVNRPGRGVPAIIGEAGAEAVLPLENNTEWMDILADKISGGNITIPITLDGKRIATYVVDIQKKKAFAMNGA